jgi:hypothetical protein
MNRKIKLFISILIFPLLFSNIGFFKTTQAATLLSDDFTGTTIDTNKWTEIDSAGTGGTAGDVQQNGSLTVANSYIGSTWGQRALISADTFDSDGLEISAVMTRASDQLLGYGDYNFQSAGTTAYILDLISGNPLALVWNNGSLAANGSCGTYTAGATYKIKVVTGAMEVYKNDVLACSLSTAVTIDNKKVFLESSAAASSFDDILVTGNSGAATAPGQVTGLGATAGQISPKAVYFGEDPWMLTLGSGESCDNQGHALYARAWIVDLLNQTSLSKLTKNEIECIKKLIPETSGVTQNVGSGSTQKPTEEHPEIEILE